MKEYKIYSLKSPLSNEIRYIGVTINKLNSRLSQHIYEGRHKDGTHKINWIKSLIKKGLKPIIELVEICDCNNWEERERYWISYYKNLTNTNEGGLGLITDRKYESIERSAKSKHIPIVKLTLSGDFVRFYGSIKEAQVDMGFKSNSSITNALKQSAKSKTAGNHFWVYKKDYDNSTYVLPKLKKRAQKVLCINEFGEKTIFESSKEAERVLGIHYKTINSLCSNTYRYKTKIKYKFSYLKNNDYD